MNYKILVKRKDSLCEATIELEKEVRIIMQEGWKPQGGVSIATDRMGYSTYYTACQAMIKEK